MLDRRDRHHRHDMPDGAAPTARVDVNGPATKATASRANRLRIMVDSVREQEDSIPNTRTRPPDAFTAVRVS